MKRATFNLHQSAVPIDKEARLKSRLQNLLQDYLDLQKDFVSKKKKLQNIHQKRDALVAEIRFLRRRRKYLLETKSVRPALDCDPKVHLPNSDLKRRMVKSKRNQSAYVAAFRNQVDGQRGAGLEAEKKSSFEIENKL